MANHHGNEGTVKSGSNAIAEVTEWSLNESSMIVNDTVIGDTWETNKAIGCNKWAGTLTCFFDETDTTGQGSFTPGDSITLNLYFEGETSGDTYFSGTAICESREITTKRDGIIEAKLSFIGNGTLSTSTVA